MNLIFFVLQMAVLGCTLVLCVWVHAKRRGIKKLIHDEIEPVKDMFAAIGELRTALKSSAPDTVVVLRMQVSAASGFPPSTVIAQAFRDTALRLRAAQHAPSEPPEGGMVQ